MKHYFQETEYTCACATARMLLEHLKDIKMSESQIEKEMKTDPIVGSSTNDLIEYIKGYGIESKLYENSSIGELKATKGIKLLLYMVHGYPHVGIIESTTDDEFLLVDASLGKWNMKFEYLDSRWYTDENVKSFIQLL
jgi:predicted double-glycine peptidase